VRNEVLRKSLAVTGVGAGSRETYVWLCLALAGLAFFVGWVEWSPLTIGRWTVEDGPVETLSATLFFVGGIAFLVAARRSAYLRERASVWAYVVILLWAALCFVCAGEEISWGQRIIGFETPEKIKSANLQEEFNIHNLAVFYESGSTYRYLSIFILLTGLVIPAIAATAWGLNLTRALGNPVAPWVLAPAFVGAYLFGHYYIGISPNPDIQPANAINEAREFLIGWAVALFGIYSAKNPQAMFRLPDAGNGSSPA
jgi:hypothetical protein